MLAPEGLIRDLLILDRGGNNNNNKGVKSTLDSYSAVLCDAVKKDYVQFVQQCCRENEGENIRGPAIEKVCRGDQDRLIDDR
jgi:hypothetical protein